MMTIAAESVPPAEALERLRQGNARFKDNTVSVGALVSQLRRSDHALAQRPFAIVLTCSDSRVPVEMIFDQGIGDLFVIRVAGNIVAPSLVGSVEFAAATFGTRLVVVMGHTGCGAVKATLDFIRGDAEIPSDNIRDIVDRITPFARTVVEAAPNEATPDELLAQAIRANARGSADRLRHGSRILEEMVSRGRLAVVCAEYSLSSGAVEFIDVPARLD